jgi:hypothetical protein
MAIVQLVNALRLKNSDLKNEIKVNSQGIQLSETTAKLLGVKEGDFINFAKDDETKEYYLIKNETNFIKGTNVLAGAKLSDKLIASKKLDTLDEVTSAFGFAGIKAKGGIALIISLGNELVEDIALPILSMVKMDNSEKANKKAQKAIQTRKSNKTTTIARPDLADLNEDEEAEMF